MTKDVKIYEQRNTGHVILIHLCFSHCFRIQNSNVLAFQIQKHLSLIGWQHKLTVIYGLFFFSRSIFRNSKCRVKLAVREPTHSTLSDGWPVTEGVCKLCQARPGQETKIIDTCRGVDNVCLSTVEIAYLCMCILHFRLLANCRL